MTLLLKLFRLGEVNVLGEGVEGGIGVEGTEPKRNDWISSHKREERVQRGENCLVLGDNE